MDWWLLETAKSDDGTGTSFLGNWKFTERETHLRLKSYSIGRQHGMASNSEDQTTTVILTNGAGYLKRRTTAKVLTAPNKFSWVEKYWETKKVGGLQASLFKEIQTSSIPSTNVVLLPLN
ncbi:MAG: hypothetical protein V8Q32_08005 [Anaerotignum faecicola]